MKGEVGHRSQTVCSVERQLSITGPATPKMPSFFDAPVFALSFAVLDEEMETKPFAHPIPAAAPRLKNVDDSALPE